MATVHNPTNFNPADYNVVDYFDNRPPQFYIFDAENTAEATARYHAELAEWKAGFKAVYGDNWMQKIHHCAHCGNGNVRWITAVRHIPSGEVVTFGSDCTERLGFANQNAFKLAMLQRKADSLAATLKMHKRVEEFCNANPVLKAAREQFRNNEVHASNHFVRDVLTKLAKWGTISGRQIEAIAESLKRDTQKASAPVEAKVAGPVGKNVVITGEIVSVKPYTGDYGTCNKITIKVSTPNGIWLAWGTAPANIDTNQLARGARVELTANTEAGNEAHFVFFKRPRLAKFL
jgi:hypothetical protein